MLSSRPERPGFFFRAVFRRAGSRSGGTVATLQPNPNHRDHLPLLSALCVSSANSALSPPPLFRTPSLFCVLAFLFGLRLTANSCRLPPLDTRTHLINDPDRSIPHDQISHQTPTSRLRRPSPPHPPLPRRLPRTPRPPPRILRRPNLRRPALLPLQRRHHLPRRQNGLRHQTPPGPIPAPPPNPPAASCGARPAPPSLPPAALPAHPRPPPPHTLLSW